MYDYVEIPKPKESGFDLSYSNKLTMDFGDIVPVLKQEILPGDEFKVNSQFMVRMAPLANPIFTKIDAQIHYFFVPNRLLWNGSKGNDWQTFITGGKDGKATPVPPFIDLSNVYAYSSNDAGGEMSEQSLADYFGFPLAERLSVPEGYLSVNAFPFLAYQKIYDDWFRDCNVTTSIIDANEDYWLNGGEITRSLTDLVSLKKRSWKKDYFTSALPWAQRGDEVHIPVNTKFFAESSVGGFDEYNDYPLGEEYNGVVLGKYDEEGESIDGPYRLSSLSLGTIRDLRNASALQLWLEKNAIGGARYIEQILSHFGIQSEDQRLQRAEYLGSIKSPVVISEVQSNADTTNAPLGKLAGKGVSYGNDFAFNKKFTEHGWIIGVMTVMPEATYAQGIHRSFSNRQTKLDYAWPEFAELGLQEIQNGEIFASFDSEMDFDEEFGYNDRYAEYKSNYNEVHGFFKNKENTLAQYNMTRFFEDTPELSSSFLEVNEGDITSPFVDTSSNSGNLWVDIWHDIKAIRPLPKNSIPLF